MDSTLTTGIQASKVEMNKTKFKNNVLKAAKSNHEVVAFTLSQNKEVLRANCGDRIKNKRRELFRMKKSGLGGYILIMLGIWLFLEKLGVISSHMIGYFWPLLLIVIGICIVAKRRESR